eukprot:TRINITY_DN2063_c0_g1_i1.p1 TRINITY_DN2063_c0_g1~~TRINITY_DN2063_c0_g1_i1.p1  ORF type:complete len:287 (-),score=97.06 TRINITY_DN2063_c0_g1_i1:359-1219(-)
MKLDQALRNTSAFSSHATGGRSPLPRAHSTDSLAQLPSSLPPTTFPSGNMSVPSFTTTPASSPHAPPVGSSSPPSPSQHTLSPPSVSSTAFAARPASPTSVVIPLTKRKMIGDLLLLSAAEGGHEPPTSTSTSSLTSTSPSLGTPSCALTAPSLSPPTSSAASHMTSSPPLSSSLFPPTHSAPSSSSSLESPVKKSKKEEHLKESFFLHPLGNGTLPPLHNSFSEAQKSFLLGLYSELVHLRQEMDKKDKFIQTQLLSIRQELASLKTNSPSLTSSSVSSSCLKGE